MHGLIRQKWWGKSAKKYYKIFHSLTTTQTRGRFLWFLKKGRISHQEGANFSMVKSLFEK